MNEVVHDEVEVVVTTRYVPNKEGIEDMNDLRDFVFEVLDQCSFTLMEGVTFQDINRNPKFWKKAVEEDNDNNTNL